MHLLSLFIAEPSWSTNLIALKVWWILWIWGCLRICCCCSQGGGWSGRPGMGLEVSTYYLEKRSRFVVTMVVLFRMRIVFVFFKEMEITSWIPLRVLSSIILVFAVTRLGRFYDFSIFLVCVCSDTHPPILSSRLTIWIIWSFWQGGTTEARNF